ncbi:MAG TPA: FAD/NAD(P)-binding oxidoreductase [Terriglobales bacterium]|jgi:NADPH-dependent 2,4-dienoyl-CoA reductase/sulfur reductase-like enzyme
MTANKQFDVLVVGGGPAGLAAAASAAQHGVRVGVVDENPNLGGQIWRQGIGGTNTEAENWIRKLRSADAEILCGMRVFDYPTPNVLHAETHDDLVELRYRKLVLATGARERFLPFPGWTLPNVMGAGGLQALVKSGFSIAGKRVVVAGTGPLLLAVAAYLHSHSAQIAMICEQVSLRRLAKFGFSLLSHPDKIAQGRYLRKQISGVPFVPSCWPVAAEGQGTLRAVVISRGEKFERIECDFLACGFHLVPNVELATLLGCRLRNGFITVDEFQQTTVPNIFCAGEPTGIGGVELAVTEGQIAGHAAAGHPKSARTLFRDRRKLRKFGEVLERTFALRPELREVPVAETLVCRCEDVTYARLKAQPSWRAAKLQTRCGMGPCQGRVCGPQTEFLFGWSADSVRPPIFPARVENLGRMLPDIAPAYSETLRGPQ